MALVYIGLGTNLGDRAENISRMVEGIAGFGGTQVLKGSSVYASPPWNMESDSEFYNSCILVKTLLAPEEMLEKAGRLEASLGRSPDSHFKDRPADIDLLWWEGVTLTTDELILPHVDLFEREFVLRPLLEIVHPTHTELRMSIELSLEGMERNARRLEC